MITPDSPYFAQVRLLVAVLPIVARERCFALKGGTAINLLVRDMPRLSVDIDLAFLTIGSLHRRWQQSMPRLAESAERSRATPMDFV